METNNEQQKKSSIKDVVIALLALALIGTWGYIIYEKNNNREINAAKDNIIVNTTNERDVLKRELDNATVLYEEIKTQSAATEHSKDSIISKRDAEIASKQAKIQAILGKGNASSAELAQARSLITELRNEITGYKTDIERLEGEKLVLTQERDGFQKERDAEREKVVAANKTIDEKDAEIDIASTLAANNFYIVGINEKRGGKEKETSTAKRVDKFRISFDIAENRVSKTGVRKLFVIVKDPAGKVISQEALGSGTFVTRENETKNFTQFIDVNYVKGQRQTISIDWRNDGKYETGDYTVEVYENGFPIGKTVKSLRKGGMFS
jgi:hypothetical protein